MDSTNNAFTLDLAYRLTVAVNVIDYRAESFAWLESWNDEALDSAKNWKKHLSSSIVNNEHQDILAIPLVNEIVECLARGYSGIRGNSHTPLEDCFVYRQLVQCVHKTSFAPVFEESKRSGFFLLGQQLAQNDLRAYFAAMNEPNKQVTVCSEPLFAPLSGYSFPPSWAEWPDSQSFNDSLLRYVNNRACLAIESLVFSMGALTSLTLSVVCPDHFPSTVWAWQDWEGGKPWHLLLAGRLVPSPIHLLVKDKNDQAFVGLLRAMGKDKKTGREAGSCGWMLRCDLWPGKTPNTCSKAWRKMTKKTLPRLGKFEFDGKVGKNKETGGRCRAPGALAGPDCRIFVEAAK